MEKITNIKESYMEVRTVDEIGRIVIPVDKRKLLKINVGEKLAIYESGQNIIIEKIESSNIKNIQVLLDTDIQLDIHISKINKQNNNKLIYTRTIDELGRIIIPTEIRTNKKIKER